MFNKVSCGIEDTVCCLTANETIWITGIVLNSTWLAKIVLAFGHNRFNKLTIANRTYSWESFFVQVISHTTDLIIAFFPTTRALVCFAITLSIGSFSDKLHLFSLSFLFKLLVKLVTTFIVTSIMDKYTRIAVSTISVLVVVFAALGVVIDSSCYLDESWCFLRAFQCTWELLLTQVIFWLSEVIWVAVLATVDLWV